MTYSLVREVTTISWATQRRIAHSGTPAQYLPPRSSPVSPCLVRSSRHWAQRTECFAPRTAPWALRISNVARPSVPGT